MFRKTKKLNSLLDRLIFILERINLCDYIEYLDNPYKLLFKSFLIGLAKGFGSVIGVTVLGGIVIFILVETNILSIPTLNHYVRRIFDMS